jgi:hypothetical protein
MSELSEPPQESEISRPTDEGQPVERAVPEDHLGGHGLDKPITWSSAVRLGLGYAGEYALLSLIEDAPEALKVATVLCSIGALAALEARDWLEHQRQYSFRATVTSVSVVYLGFVGYAISHSVERHNVRLGLQKIYTDATPLLISH